MAQDSIFKAVDHEAEQYLKRCILSEGLACDFLESYLTTKVAARPLCTHLLECADLCVGILRPIPHRQYTDNTPSIPHSYRLCSVSRRRGLCRAASSKDLLAGLCGA